MNIGFVSRSAVDYETGWADWGNRERADADEERKGAIDLCVRWVMRDQGKGISGPSVETSAHEARKLNEASENNKIDRERRGARRREVRRRALDLKSSVVYLRA